MLVKLTMLEKEKYCNLDFSIKKVFFLNLFFLFFFLTNQSLADLKENLFNKLIYTETLTFNFEQKIGEKEETGNCFIKYPLMMKCNYQNSKQKILISNGKTVAIIKKKYKKIYYYPIKSTPLFIILNKETMLNLIKNNKLSDTDLNTVEFEFIDKKKNKLKILFDKKTLDLKGWKTKDSYSNEVSFNIKNLKINNQIMDNFFKIPQEEDL